jgi:hyperosmotically inducible protein
MNSKFLGTLVLLATITGSAAASAQDTSKDTPGEYLDDAAITTMVKAAFFKEDAVKVWDIGVRTDHGVVDLTGRVGSKGDSDRATALATRVKAVKAVHNNLTIAAK